MGLSMVMKNVLLKLLLTISLFSTQFCMSQKVKVEGFVRQSAKERMFVQVVVNDTINKIEKLDSIDFTLRNKIYKEGELVTSSNEKGYFSIRAKLSDSLFFRFGRLYYPERYAVSDLKKLKKIILEPRPIPCISEKECDEKKPSKLFTFIGKKINVSYVDTSKYCYVSMDDKYKAVYKIEQDFSEQPYSGPIIVFTAYDHNSQYKYDFRNYENVLLFVGEFCGELVLLKYQFFPVYKVANGRWATPVDANMERYYENSEIKLVPISFEESIIYDYPADLSEKHLEWRFPKQYYQYKSNNKAVPIMGRYAEELIKLEKEIFEKDGD